VRTAICITLLLAGRAAACAAGPFDWFAVSDLVRVFEDGYNNPARTQSVVLSGVRGETVSAQCVVAAREDLARVSVTAPPLAGPGAAIPVRWNFVAGVPVPQNTPGVKPDRVARKAPAQFPDYLAEDAASAVAAGKQRAVWLTVAIPPEAAPGTYQGAVAVKADRGEASLPVVLTVHPARMPDQRHLLVTYWFSTHRFQKLHDTGEYDSESFLRVLREYAANMAAHRQNVFRVSINTVRATMATSGSLSFDFSRFDRWADIFWSTGRMDRLETGFIAKRGPLGWYDPLMPLEEWTVPKEGARERVKVSGEQYLAQLLPALERHLREKGWLEKTLFHIADEPVHWNARSFRRASDLVKRYAPSLRRIDAIEGTDFAGALEVWVPKLNHLNSWFDTYRQRQREGNELWYYLAMPAQPYPNRFIDFPLIETRILPWLNYRFDIAGFLHWGFNSWTDNPFETMNDVKVGAGDAWTVYPKKGGLLDSLRWEVTRNGLQDYEYLWLLEDRIRGLKAQAGAGFEWIEPRRRGVELAGRVIREMNDFTQDPQVLYSARAEVLREYMDLARSPRLLVQTEPPEGGTLLGRSAMAEVWGLAEPGTEISVNGKPVAVGANGYFATAATLTTEKNKVLVVAKGPGGEKRTERAFKVVW
jgi:hypothetical protein